MVILTCLSLAGFQSGSNKTSRLAPIKFNPQPPALLLKRNANSSYRSKTRTRWLVIITQVCNKGEKNIYKISYLCWVVQPVNKLLPFADWCWSIQPQIRISSFTTELSEKIQCLVQKMQAMIIVYRLDLKLLSMWNTPWWWLYAIRQQT